MKTERKKLLEKLNQIGERVAKNFNFELVEVAYEEEAYGLYLRFYIDSDSGIQLDDCEKYHMELMKFVEDYPYDFLEVCSPGLDRPIKTDRDAKRAMGEEVELKLFKQKDGKKIFTGIFNGMTENEFNIIVSGKEMVFEKKDVSSVKRILNLDNIDEIDMEEGK